MNWRDKNGPVFADWKGRGSGPWVTRPCDSGGLPKGEDAPQSAAECEASQSGAAKTAHRPNSAQVIHLHPRKKA